MLQRIRNYFIIGLYVPILIFAALMPQQVLAASPYDNLIYNTSSLDTVTVNWGSGTPQNWPITTITDWRERIFDEESYVQGRYDNPYEAEMRILYPDITSGDYSYLITKRTTYNGSGYRTYGEFTLCEGLNSISLTWLTTQVYANMTGKCMGFHLGWTPQLFGDHRVAFSDQFYCGDGGAYTSGDCSGIYIPVGQATLDLTVASYGGWTPVYPLDYEGVPIQDSIPGAGVETRPQFRWDAILRSFTLTDTSPAPPGVTNYRIKYDVVVGEIEDNNYIELFEAIVDPLGSQKIDLTRTANVGVTATFIDLEGNPLEDTDEIDYRTTNVTFYIDGTTFSGSTSGSECDDDDLCTGGETDGVSPYADCSVYNIDITFWAGAPTITVPSIETITCEFNNFWLKFNDFIRFLFVPDLEAIQTAFDTFLSVLEDKLGFVYTSFEYIIEWITSILTANADCTIDTGSGTFFGAQADFDMCVFENAAPTVWNVGIGFTRLIFAAGLIFLSYNRLFSILKGLGKS